MFTTHNYINRISDCGEEGGGYQRPMRVAGNAPWLELPVGGCGLEASWGGSWGALWVVPRGWVCAGWLSRAFGEVEKVFENDGKHH